ncbi:MAG: hypothetical protein IT179_16620 [Acidobacteria bacterium]|nr:hypothetical protein [Acidobacteriota bacterium]
MQRRTFLTRSAAAVVGAGIARRASGQTTTGGWQSLRLVAGARASSVERTVLEDAAGLFGRAIGIPVPVVSEPAAWGPSDILVGCPQTTRAMPDGLVPSGGKAGQYVVRAASSTDGPRVTIAGVDPEGARNGLYAWMERVGFGFFRDGEVVPALAGAMPIDEGASFGATPAFRWRGDMIWDNYLGPRRFCAAAWTEAEWERALLFMARRGLNFLEFYPPLEHVLALTFPKAAGLSEGAVWKATVKHALAARVLERGRALGIRFMYVLNYGFFPEPVRALYPALEWANGHLCAHQPELAAMASRTWRTLVEQLGTDHLYAIRHRGEEGQSYSDPCRSVTKAEGYRQAVDALRSVDPEATITVWTWGEQAADLFAALPSGVHAAHIRHGMGGVFDDRGQGREQGDGAPSLPEGRRWISGQFTVFGGNEVSLQTPWSDAGALARDARASAADAACDGYFQWPEWSDTSPWLSHVIARLAWAPGAFGGVESELRAYARARHGARAEAFLAGVLPILRAGPARLTHTPRKRLLVPYRLSAESLALVEAVRAGARAMAAAMGGAAASPLFDRDVTDVCEWLAMHQAQIFEADACRRHRTGDQAGALAALDAADATWEALHRLLAAIPERSIVDAAARVAEAGEPSDRFVESFWVNACDFYNGYPLVMSPEAIELVYRPQLARWRRLMVEAVARRQPMALEAPGWFWHDFPAPAWADAVRKLPPEDAPAFERAMRERLRRVVGSTQRRVSGGVRPAPSVPSPVGRDVVQGFLARTTSVPLPASIDVGGLGPFLAP